MPTIQKGYKRANFDWSPRSNLDNAWEMETPEQQRQRRWNNWATQAPAEQVAYYTNLRESVQRLNQLPDQEKLANDEFKSLFSDYWDLKTKALGGPENLRRDSHYWRHPTDRLISGRLTTEEQGEWDILTNLFEGVDGNARTVWEYDPHESLGEKVLPQREQLSGAIQIGATEARRVKTGRGKQQFTSPGGGVQL